MMVYLSPIIYSRKRTKLNVNNTKARYTKKVVPKREFAKDDLLMEQVILREYNKTNKLGLNGLLLPVRSLVPNLKLQW